MKYNVSTPSGFPEFGPAQERVRQNWLKVIREVFERNGFLPIETPLVERVENLLGKGGNPKEVYALKRVLDSDDDDSHSGNALRFDHTVPLALYVARHMNELAFPFKRYAIGPVLRGERAQKGRYRQFDQCDIDVIGSESLSLRNDAMVASVIIQIFEELDIGDFEVGINNRKILLGIFGYFGVESSLAKQCLDILDEKEKIGVDAVGEKLVATGLDREKGLKILNFIENLVIQIGDKRKKGVFDSSLELELLKNSEVKNNELFQTGVSEMEEVINTLKNTGASPSRYWLNITIARGLDYYTGTVYETLLEGHEGLGSICSGGRYDDLAEIFTSKKLPGVGISIGLTRLLGQLFDAGIIQPDRASSSEVLVIALSENEMPEALKVASALRTEGINTEVYLEDKKVGKQFDYANKLGIPWCVILGAEEVKKGVVTLKNMTKGNQEEMKIEKVVTKVR